MSLKDLQLPSIASLRAIAALRSPNLALVRPARIGLGFESAGSNQKTLLEVEDLLGGPGRLSLPYSLRWLLDVLTGLGVLHRTLGFVHGEVQPENVVLGEDGVGRLVPVVRAHWVRGESRAPERLYYLAPEKLLGDKVDARADVFSVGVLLWEALAGQRLLEATEVDDIIARLMGGGVPRAEPPEGEAWTLPLADIAERAIAVDPARRFASVAEMRQALENGCQRYLASAPGMAELFENPERRARGRMRDSLPPESQRATLPPTKPLAPLAEPRTESQRLDAAAERLSRSSFAPIEIEEHEETTVKQRTQPPPPSAPISATKSVPVGAPAPSRKTTPRKGGHVNTLLGVPPPFIERRTPIGAEQLKAVTESVAPSSSAPTVMRSLGAMNVTVPVGTPAPVITPRPAPEPEAPPWSEAGRQASLSPFTAGPDGAPLTTEPSFELVTPRKKRGALWLALGAAAAIGVFAARPWLARQVAAATGTLPFTTPPAEATEPGAATLTSLAATAAPTADPSANLTPAVGIASTPAAPEPAPRPVRAARAEPHVVIDDRQQLEPPPSPAPPPAETKPEPVAEPPPAPEPPPPPPPKPKAPPVSDADRYGI